MPFDNILGFSFALKKYMHSNLGIKRLCEELDITEKNLFDSKVVSEAFNVANKGTCIDEAFYTAAKLSEGLEPSAINEAIQEQREEMSVFHGLSQGPLQTMVGSDFMKTIYQQYNLAELEPKNAITFDLNDKNSKEALLMLLYVNKNRVFLMQLSEDASSHHWMVFKIDENGERLLAYDEKWYPNIPVEMAWETIATYREVHDYQTVTFHPLSTPKQKLKL